MNQINLGECELCWDGKRLWLNSAGGNILRLRATGRVIVDEHCQNPMPHSDIIINGDIPLCIPEESGANITIENRRLGHQMLQSQLSISQQQVERLRAALLRCKPDAHQGEPEWFEINALRHIALKSTLIKPIVEQPLWECPKCGRRYRGESVSGCANGHPAACWHKVEEP